MRIVSSTPSLLMPAAALASLLLLALSSLCVAEKCNPQDKKVLLSIKKTLNDPYILSSWDPSTDCCNWYCVDCHPSTHRIISLTIFSGQLSGHIPPAVADLPYLETLIFRHLSNITGPIPSSLARLKNLQMVRLSYLNLTGPVPEFFSTLPNLTYLDLSFNNLTGPVPRSYYKLRNLGALHLDRNQLTGSIPDSYGLFPRDNPPYLYLSHNQLTGRIPPSFGDLNWQLIDLSRNKLTGDASMLFNSNKSFYQLDISRNMLAFDVGKVQVPAGISFLDINHNSIYGSIPPSLTLPDLQGLNMSYNRMCGQIPVGGKLQNFDYSVYFHNRCLCGSPLPPCK